MASGTGAQYLKGGGEAKITQWLGLYQGYIAVNQDPLAQGRVKLRVPQVFGGTTSGWATPSVPLTYIPQVGTPVNVMFIGGDTSQPSWFGNFALPDAASGFVLAPTEPENPTLGEVWVNTATGLMSEWNGASWIAYQIGGAAIQTGVGLTEPNIIGGTITGAKFIADGTGSEYLGYAGTPADGNLVLAISPAAGSDGLGNSWGEGVSVFDSASNYISIVPGATNFIKLFSGAEYSTNPPQIYGTLENAGTQSEYQFLALVSGQQTGSTGNSAVQLFSDSNNGTANTANGSLVISGNSIAGWNASAFSTNQPLSVNAGMKTAASSLAGGVIISQTDVSATLQTNNTTYSRICNTWAIPAGDAVEGTVYRLSTFGTGSTGAATETLSFQIAGLGTAVAVFTVGSSNFAANQDFYFDLVATLIVTETGSSGILSGSIRLNLGVFSTGGTNENEISTTGTQMAGGFAGFGAVTTAVPTAASNMTVQMKWGSSSSGQTFESFGSVFERIGGNA